ncbi:MAG: low molecular weight phosphotyrosine protein phosphatase [Clostridia bacterium]|nr:low molecular weight phosphotyrosine protein phosphatase [Clostridia bacterium]
MTKILFVCHGNICRSPMAEFVMKDIVEKAGLEDEFYIESAATSTEEIGESVYPPVRSLLEKHGISCEGKRARQITRADYDNFDYIIGMDSANIRNMLRIFGEDRQGKLSLLKDYTDFPGDVADPWYTRDFNLTWNEVALGCRELLSALRNDYE